MTNGKDNKSVKIFLSYSHNDRVPFDEIRKYIQEVAKVNNCDVWCDDDINGGEIINSSIKKRLEGSDIIVMFISHDYLNSKSCRDEMNMAIKLVESKGVDILPVIVSECDWKKNEKLQERLAVPRDGKPWCQHSIKDREKAGKYIQNKLKKAINSRLLAYHLVLKDSFNTKLQDIGMLGMLSSIQDRFTLDDIFIHRTLRKSTLKSKTKDEVITEEESSELMKYTRVLLHGNSLSGKTSLAFWMFIEFRKIDMIPVYIDIDQSAEVPKDLNKHINKKLLEQYGTSNGAKIDVEKLDSKKIVPIIDNFYSSDKQRDHIAQIEKSYDRSVLVYNDTFISEFKKYKLVNSYAIFEPRILLPSERRLLIIKFIKSYNKNRSDNNFLIGEDYNREKEDEYIDKVETIIGKKIAGFIISAYPFYILSILMNDLMMSSNSGSQTATLRHYYDALIYCSLIKAGMEADDKNLYWNFLGELAFLMYKDNIKVIDELEYKKFITNYKKKFDLYIDHNDIMSMLIKINIVEKSEGKLKFKYPYIRYFFVAEYLSYHMDSESGLDTINKMVNNLVDSIGLQENAFILIFLAHNNKKSKHKLINKITDLLDDCFKGYETAQLTKSEIDVGIDLLANEVIRPKSYNLSKNTARGRIETSRTRRDEQRDEREIESKDHTPDIEEGDSQELKELKISIRAIEVLGHIIKNEFATIEKQENYRIFAQAINNHLRITKHFFEDIEPIKQEVLDDSKKLNDSEISNEIKKAISLHYFMISISTVIRVTHALGSKRIVKSLNSFCKQKDTPVNFLISFYADVRYKNGNFDELNVRRKMEDKNFPETCKIIMKTLFRYYWEYNDIPKKMLLKKAAALKLNSDDLFGKKSNMKMKPLLKNVNKYKKSN